MLIRSAAIIGTGLAAVIAIGCAGYNQIAKHKGEQLIPELQAQIDRLRDRCEAESKRDQENSWLRSPLVCDPRVLINPQHSIRVGSSRTDDAIEIIDHPDAYGLKIQNALARAQVDLQSAQQPPPIVWPYFLSVALILITVIVILAAVIVPWLWYFLLQRLRELSNAIRGV